MRLYVRLLSALALLLAGCSNATESENTFKANTVSVNVHGVNYTAEPFKYVLVDAGNPTNEIGGEHIGPYSGGGIMCCFTLPKRWKPGLQVNVRSTHWLPKTAEGDLPEVDKVYTLAIPAYQDSSAGELWVIRTAEGAIELVTSDVEPSHPHWPGKVKGWPEPSLEYQRQRWSLYKELAEYDVKVFRHSLGELQTRRQSHLEEAWDTAKKNRPGDIKNFSGPSDPAYAEYQKKNYSEGLRLSEEKLEQLLRKKP